MRKVKNQRVLRKIADKTRKAGKERNIAAILAIVMTTVLFTTVFTVGGSMIEKQQKATMRQVGGSAHAGYKYLTQEEYDIVKNDKKLKEVSYRIVVGDARNKELNKLQTEVSYYEDLDAKFSFCYPEEGHMPEKEDEIVVSDLVLDALGIPCEIGVKVPLVLNVGGKTYEKTFTLCGYFQGDRVAQSQVAAVSKEYAAEVAPTPTTTAMGKSLDVSEYAGRIMADFNFASSFRLEEQAAELAKRCGFPEEVDTGINWAYMGEMDLETVLLIGSLLLVILVSGYLIIYNIFYINVYHDIRYYGLLKTVGTTGRQLRKIVRRQAYMLSLYGIPLGLLLGIAVGKVLLPLIMNELTFTGTTDTEVVLNGGIFAGAALFSFLTVLLGSIRPCRMASRVSPVEAVRYTEGQGEKSGKRKTKKSRRVHPGEMALQNIRRNRKKVVIVVSSLSLALVLLNSIYSFVRGFDMDKFVSNMVVSDFSVADATLDNLSVTFDSIVTDGVTEEFLQDLKEQKGVEEIGNIYMKELFPTFTDEAYTRLEERIFENEETRTTLEYLAGEEGIEWIEDLREERYIDGKVYGIGEAVMEKLENPEGTLDWEKFSSGNYVIASRFRTVEEEGVDFFLPGERVTVTNEVGETREYEVLAVADMPYSCGLHHFGMFDCNYILPEEEYLHFMGEQNPMRTIFNVESSYEEKMEKWVSDYCENVNPDLTFQSKASIVEEFDSHKNMYAMAGGLLALILAMIGILNFVNTMVTSVLSRKQEFAMMEAVGMTGKQLQQMLCFEGGYYAVFTGVCAILLSVFFNMTVVRMVGEGLFFFTWRFTILPVLACIPVLLLLVVVVPVICHKKLSKESVVERIRLAEV
ncbi:MAG: ABC transporter permease [Ruminococcus sp.]|nr:ABC transporter permease [Ruminococcus sp.]